MDSSSATCFARGCPAGQIDSYVSRGRLILLAAALRARPWCSFGGITLTDGEPDFTLTQVALNDTIMVFAFAPIVALLLGLSAITVPWDTLLLSVVLYIVVPVVLAQIVRAVVLSRAGPQGLSDLLISSGFSPTSPVKWRSSPHWSCCSGFPGRADHRPASLHDRAARGGCRYI